MVKQLPAIVISLLVTCMPLLKAMPPASLKEQAASALIKKLSLEDCARIQCRIATLPDEVKELSKECIIKEHWPFYFDIFKKHSCKELKSDSKVTALAMSPDASCVLTGHLNGKAILWNLAADHIMQQNLGTLGRAVCLASFTHDGSNHAATGSLLGNVIVWDFPSRLSKILNSAASVYALAISPNHRYVVRCTAQGAFLYDLCSNNPESGLLLEWADRKWKAMSFTADSMGILTCSMDNSIELYDLRQTPIKPKLLIPGFTGASELVYKAAFSRDGRYAITATNKAIRLWDLASPCTTPRILPIGNYCWVVALAISADNRFVLKAGTDGFVQLIDLSQKNLEPQLIASEWSDDGGELAFSPDGRFIMAGAVGKNNTRVWNVTQHVRELTLMQLILLLKAKKDPSLLKTASAIEIIKSAPSLLQELIKGYTFKVNP